ncbi:MAG: ATP-binding cassette domain-containing protein [Planctomycetota bacterium]
MGKYNIERRFPWEGRITEKSAAVMKMFGVDVKRLQESTICHRCEVEISKGEVCYITGASGSGKSLLLRELYQAVNSEGRINLEEIDFPQGTSVVDCIAGNFYESLQTLSAAGLSDILCVLNEPRYLSEGQKYRLRLAMALCSGAKMIFADEFCSNLDRITAAVIAYNIRKYADRYGVGFVLASSHEDIVGDLSPDVLIFKQLNGSARVVYRENRDQWKGDEQLQCYETS